MHSLSLINFVMLSVAAAAALLLPTVGGCKEESRTVRVRTSPTSQPVDVAIAPVWQDTQLHFKQESVCVVQGPTPLLHIFDVGGPIRVVDLTAQKPLWAAFVADRTLVRVDDRNGVTIGSEHVVPGPLVAGHQYGIYLDPQTDNTMRQGLGRPASVDAPSPPPQPPSPSTPFGP